MSSTFATETGSVPENMPYATVREAPSPPRRRTRCLRAAF